MSKILESQIYLSGISVVIPTEGRTTLVCDLLEALYNCKHNFHLPIEILLVDSSSADERKNIASTCDRVGAQLINGPINVREKRNLGISLAKYKVILFLDSDVKPGDNVLFEHWNSYNQDLQANIAGVLGPVVFSGPANWVWRHIVQNSSLLTAFQFASHQNTSSWGPTANISYLHSVLDEVGGFDVTFPFHLGCDDVDLGYRVTKMGYILRCNPQAKVYHSRTTWNNLWSVIKRSFRWGRMQYYLYRKFPEARVSSPPSFWGWAILVIILFSFQAFYLHNIAVLYLLPLLITISLLVY